MNYAIKKLQKELQELQSETDLPFTVGLDQEDSLFRWNVVIIGEEGTLYEGAILNAQISFPQNYPFEPPQMKFTQKMFHPNIFPDGRVCISILHKPEIDVTNEQERLDEKWRPVLGVKEIVLSVLCVLYEPNLDSPANVDAAKR